MSLLDKRKEHYTESLVGNVTLFLIPDSWKIVTEKYSTDYFLTFRQFGTLFTLNSSI